MRRPRWPCTQTRISELSSAISRRPLPQWGYCSPQAHSHPGAAASGPGEIRSSAGVPVSVVKAEQSNVPVNGEWVGTLDGYVNAQIQPQANGYLIRQDYREGAPVEKGQILFEIDPRPFEAALHQAEGQLGQAQAQLALARSTSIATRRLPKRMPSHRVSSTMRFSRKRRLKRRSSPPRPRSIQPS